MPLEKAYRWAQRMTTQEQTYEREPDPALRVSYIVPIRDEIRQANVFIQLQDFMRQRGPTEHFEIVYVVNTALRDKYSGTHHWYANQQLLALLSYAGRYTDTLAASVEEWQKVILDRCREKGLHITILDKSTKGMLTPGIEQARTIGDNYVKERFDATEIGENGAIVVLDADTRFGSHTTERIDEQLVSRDEVGMIYGGFDSRPHIGPPLLFATAGAHRHIANLGSVLSQLGLLEPKNGWYAAKARALSKRSPRTARPYLRDVRQPTHGTRMAAEDIPMITQDRAHTRAEGGSFGAQRLESLQDGTYLQRLGVDDPSLLFLQYHIARLKKERVLSDAHIAALTTVFQDALPIAFLPQDNLTISATIPSNRVGSSLFTCFEALLNEHPHEQAVLRACVERALKRERRVHSYTRHAVQSMLSRAYETTQPITKEVLLGKNSGKETRLNHYLQENPWIVELSATLKTRYPTKEAAFDALAAELPDILGPVEQTPHTEDTGILIGLSNFMAKVQRTPQDFPFFSHILLEREP